MRCDKRDWTVALIIVTAGVFVLGIFLAPASTQPVEAANAQPNPYAAERISPPEVARIQMPLRAVPTGMVATIPLPSPLLGGPMPTAGALGPNVRVWDNPQNESRPTLAVDPDTNPPTCSRDKLVIFKSQS